ncbi:MAG: DUF1772 domain-containing protein [bacterium]|jgi:hypothetical protein|nr:DUF1772 domain-containing protein [bacterium]
MGKVALVGLTAWFFGNLYEGLVGVPQLLAGSHSRRERGVLAVGSPVRYFAPVAGVALAPTVVSLVRAGRRGASPPLIGVAAACVASAVGLSGYLIRTVNLPLLTADESLTSWDRDRLVRRWHRVNAVRPVALAGALGSLSRLPVRR